MSWVSWNQPKLTPAKITAISFLLYRDEESIPRPKVSYESILATTEKCSEKIPLVHAEYC